MTKQWYQEHGFKISSLIDETEIDRAERDVVQAYVLPIEGSATIPSETREGIVGQLAFLLLLQRSVFLTRAGAKTKSGYNSYDADAWALLQQEAQTCALAIDKLRAYGSNPTAEVVDICKIYFKSNFISV